MQRRYWLYAAAFALPMAQVGHVLAYSARYGSAAVAVQSSGAHAYFPSLLAAGVMLLGAAALTALLLVGGARLLLGRSLGYEQRAGISIRDLFVVCLCFQLDVHIVQEVLETLTSGQALSLQLVAPLLAFGLAGQAPVALLSALALHWLSIRLEPIVQELRWILDRALPGAPPVLAVVPVPRPPFGSRRPQQVACAAWTTRGPPPIP